MSRVRYTEKFKAEAIKQITERGHGVAEIAKRLGISDKSLYVWLKQRQQLSGSVAKDGACKNSCVLCKRPLLAAGSTDRRNTLFLEERMRC